MKKGLYMIICSGYSTIYVVADSFDHARQKWLDQYVNINEDTGRPYDEPISPMPETISFMAGMEEIIP